MVWMVSLPSVLPGIGDILVWFDGNCETFDLKQVSAGRIKNLSASNKVPVQACKCRS